MKWTSNSDKKEWNTGLKKGWLVHRSGEVNHSKLICNLFWFLAVRISKKLKSAYKHEKIGQISCQGTFAIAIRSPVQPDQYLQVENWGVKWRTGKVWETFTQRNFPKTKIDFSEIDIESNDFHSNIECDTVSISKYKESGFSDFSKSVEMQGWSRAKAHLKLEHSHRVLIAENQLDVGVFFAINLWIWCRCENDRFVNIRIHLSHDFCHYFWLNF